MTELSAPVYSICITHYNNAATVRKALESILVQIDGRFEIVVVDNFSTDGSRAILEEYLKSGRIQRLVERRCTRGLGRQTAVDNSTGRYIIADLDMDDEFRPDLLALVDFYHTKCEGSVLAAVADTESNWSKNVTIGPRALIQELGGWPDLQVYEDSNLWGRAALRSLYRWTSFSLVTAVGEHVDRRSSFGRFRFRYLRYRELLRQGRISMVKGELKGAGGRSALLLARMAAPFYRSYKRTTNTQFRPRDQDFFVRFWSNGAQA